MAFKKEQILKLALDNKALRPHLLALMGESEARKKTAGALWLREFATGKDPEAILKKFRERDFKELQNQTIKNLNEQFEFELKEQKETKAFTAYKLRAEKLESLKKEALAAVERKFQPLIDENERRFKESEKETTQIKAEKEKNLQEEIKAIKDAKPDLPEKLEGALRDRMAYAGSFAPKLYVEKLSKLPLTKTEAETLAWEVGQKGDKWSPTVLAVPIGQEGKIEGWYLFGWSAE